MNVYTDEGITGTSTKHRDGFKRMIADALSGRIDLIITKSVSRFARNTVDSLTTIRQLKEKGVEVYFEKENIWTFDGKGELLITIMSSLAQEESRSISENVTWGKRKRMADGKVSIPFDHFLGYDRGPNGELIINPEQAETVRLIYELFLEGLTPHSIAAQLTEMGIPTPAHKEVWLQGTVLSILTNEKYKGDALLQKYYTEDFLTKKTITNTGAIQQYYVEGDHEAIIPPETFELVQQEVERRRRKKGHYSGVDIFASRIVCAECGGYYGAKVWHSNNAKYRRTVYRCNGKYGSGHKCGTPHVTEEQMQQLFVAAVNRLITSKAEIVEALKETGATIFDTSALEAEEKQLSDEMNMLAGMIQNIIRENAHVALDQTEFQTRYNELADRYESLKHRHDEVEQTISQKTSAKVASQQFIVEIEKLEQPITEFKRELWGALLDHATVHSQDDIRFTFRNGTEIKGNTA